MPPISQSAGSYASGSSEKETTDEISGVGTHGAHGGDSAERYSMTWTSQEDELASALEDCVSVFRSGLQQLQDINIEDLVFCRPPKDAADSDPLDPPPYKSLRPQTFPSCNTTTGS